MRRIFKRKYEQTYGPIFSKICVHVYVEKGTTMSEGGLAQCERGESTDIGQGSLARHLQGRIFGLNLHE